ncbi:MAG: DUF3488 domain-containing protein, partial [Betaproteobacteria bacterium]|nr:DUF3488 domain-containing protein [Betaproteobacteria bacterium]
LYWRGPVLSEQFGRTWRMAATREITSLDFEAEGQPVRYRVTLQPSNQPWLFALDLPTVAPNGAFFLDDFQMRSRTPVTALKAYEVSSQLRYKIETNMSERKQARYMRYDTNLNPRTIAFGKQLRQDNPDPKAMVEALLKIYNTQFDYTLEPPALGENSVDEFFFDTKKGFCEHYASSFVLILRAAGVPARVVTGYQGGEVNPITRQLIVRQSEAHAWAEVWFPDLGWVRVDPTFAVSPLRINRGITAALGPVGVFNTFMEADQLGFLRQMRYSWDAVNSQWNQWVIGFSADRQRSMMENLFGLSQVDWRQLVWWLIGGMAFAAASVGSLLMVRAYQTRKAPVLIAYERLCAKLAKAGFTRAPHEGPRDLLARIAQHRPDLAAKAAPLLEAYIALRYAPPDDTASVGAFARSVRRFKPG